MKYLLKAAFTAVILSPWLALAAPDAAQLEQTLIGLQNSLAQAEVHKNAGLIERTVADDFMQVKTNGETAKKADLIDDAGESDVTDVILYNFKLVSVNENCAVLTYDAVIHHAKRSEGSRRYQHISSVWAKQGNDWKLKFQQLTPNLWSAEDID